MTFEPIWGAIIAWYLFLAGLGGGAFVTAALVRWKYPQAAGIRRIGHIIAPLAVVVGLLLLMIDAKAGLHNPLRFVFLLSNFGSVMTWGVVFLGAFTLLSVATAALEFMHRPVPWWLEVAGSVLAVCVAAYTGALLGVCKTFPLWNTAILPVLFLASAMSTGAASVFLAALLRCRNEFHQITAALKLHLVFPVVETVLVVALLFVTQYNSVAGLESVASLVAGSWAPLFWVGFAVIGLCGPLAMEVWLLFFAPEPFERGSRGRLVSAVANAGVLVGGFLLRFLIVVAALPLVVVTPLF